MKVKIMVTVKIIKVNVKKWLVFQLNTNRRSNKSNKMKDNMWVMIILTKLMAIYLTKTTLKDLTMIT